MLKSTPGSTCTASHVFTNHPCHEGVFYCDHANARLPRAHRKARMACMTSGADKTAAQRFPQWPHVVCTLPRRRTRPRHGILNHGPFGCTSCPCAARACSHSCWTSSERTSQATPRHSRLLCSIRAGHTPHRGTFRAGMLSAHEWLMNGGQSRPICVRRGAPAVARESHRGEPRTTWRSARGVPPARVEHGMRGRPEGAAPSRGRRPGCLCAPQPQWQRRPRPEGSAAALAWTASARATWA